MERLSGKVALVTGGGAGIGRATAMLFAREGAHVAIVEMNREAGQRTLEELQAAGGSGLLVAADITEPDSMMTAVKHAVATFGRLDILHNNAGGSTAEDGPVTRAPEEEFWRKIKLDLFGAWLGCRFAIPEMIKGGGGSVINMTSICALVGTHNKDAYTAAKGGVASLTRSMAVEYATDKVRVNAIAPGVTRTERLIQLMERDGSSPAIAKGQLLGLVDPTDIAYAAVYLASDEARTVTGQILTVDGGYIAA